MQSETPETSEQPGLPAQQAHEQSQPLYPPPFPPAYPMYPQPPVTPEQVREQEARRGALGRWMTPLIATLAAVIVVFAVLDISQALFPRRVGTTRPIIIQVQNGNGDSTSQGSTGGVVALAASPTLISLTCGQSATLEVTNTASYGVHWAVDALPDGIALSVDSPHGGGLAPGEHASMQVISLGRSLNASLRFSEDRGSTLSVPVEVRC